MAAIFLMLLLAGCAEMNQSSHDITSHCMQHTIGAGAAGTTTIEDCSISVETKNKSTGF